MTGYLQEVIKPQLSELILQMYTEVHVLHRMDHNVDELHTSHLRHKTRSQTHPCLTLNTDVLSCTYHEVDVPIFTTEILHQLLKAVLLLTNLHMFLFSQSQKHSNPSVQYKQICQVLKYKV